MGMRRAHAQAPRGLAAADAARPGPTRARPSQTRFIADERVYKSFLEILNLYRKGQKSIKQVYSQVSTLFANQPDLLEEFTNFLPDSQAPAAEAKKAARAPKARAAAPPAKNQRKGAKGKKEADGEGGDKKSSAIKKELEFFDKVKSRLRNREQYSEFLKCLNLFSQEIINRSELQGLVYDILGRYPDLMHGFNEFLGRCETMGSKPVPEGVEVDAEAKPTAQQLAKKAAQAKADEKAAKAAAQRDKAMSMRPVADLDLSNCERCGPSYRLLPKGYQRLACSGRSPDQQAMLNDDWVSISSGTEDANSFKNMRKNQYEENLFRCEDDRFELDMMIETNASCVRVMEGLNKKVNDLPPEERQSMKIEPAAISPVHYRCIERIYGDHGSDIVDLLRKNPGVAVPVVLTRLKQKDEEWHRVQQEMNKVWREVYEKNYSKSLDHRSFYFKQMDKKQLSAKGLLQDIKEASEKRRAGAAEGAEGADITLRFEDTLVHADVHKMLGLGCSETLSPDAAAKVLKFFRDSVASVLGAGDEATLAAALTAAGADTAPKVPKKKGSSEDENMDVDGNGTGADTEGPPTDGDTPSADEDEDEDESKFLGCRPLAAMATQALAAGVDVAQPPGMSASRTMFCNDNLYILFRLHQTLFDRLRSAKVAAAAAAKAKGNDTPEGAASTYEQFQGLVARLIEGGLDSSKFEDECRALLGTGCYNVFTIDKLLYKVIKQVQTLQSEDVGSKLLSLHKYECSRADGYSKAAYIANACVLVGDDPCYELEYTADADGGVSGALSLSMMEDASRVEPPACAMDPDFEAYLTSLVGSGAGESSNVFLRRSARKAPKPATKGCTVRNGLECEINCTSYKVSYALDTEDVFVRRRNTPKPTLPTDYGVEKFRRWVDSKAGDAKAAP